MASNAMTYDLSVGNTHHTPNKLRLSAAITALASVCAATGTAVSAQETSRQMLALEEVVVTARRRQEVLTDVPIAVTALGEDFLRTQNITTVEDLGIVVPSLRISGSGATTNVPIVTLRGQRPSDLIMSVDPAVPMYFAEVVLTPAEGTNLALYDLANVQVLKGPQGTLFGRNSTGGAILITPQAPGSEFGGYAEVRIGDYDLLHLEGAVDIPVSDNLAFRLAGRSVDRDGYQDNIADTSVVAFAEDNQYWDEDSYGVRLSMALSIGGSLENNLVVSYDENDAIIRMGVPSFYNSSASLATLVNFIHNANGELEDAIARQNARDWTQVESDVLVPDRVENTFVSNITEWELTDSLTIKNVFGYREVVTEGGVDADGTAVPYFGSRTSQTLTYTSSPELRDLDAEQFSEEIQLVGDSLDGDLEWILGGFWMKMEGSERYPNQVVGAKPGWSNIGIPPIDIIGSGGFYQLSPNSDLVNEAWAVFGEGTYTFNDQWSLTVGARYTVDERELENRTFSLDSAFPPDNPLALTFHCAVRDENNEYLPDASCSRTEDEKFDSPTWRASINYTPNDDHLIYLSSSTGYRTGGFNMRGTNNFTLQPFDEETILSFEVGHKGDWSLGNALLRTNLAIYYQDYQDIQKTVSGVNPQSGNFETYTINAAEATIQGVELDVTLALTENLTLSAGYSFVDAGYDDWPRLVELPPRSGNIVERDYTRADFLYIPENTVTATANYSFPIDPEYGVISIAASMYWQDEMITNDDPWLWPELGWAEDDLAGALATVETDSYSVWNFRIDWREVMGSGIDIAAYVDNAFDEDYVTGGLSIPEDLGMVVNTYGAPRTVGAVLRYNF